MSQKIRWKCTLLVLGVLLLILLPTVGRGRQKETKQEGTAGTEQQEQEGTQAGTQEEESLEEVPVPEFNGNIRVLIRSGNYESLYHEDLEIAEDQKNWSFTREGKSLYLNGELLEKEDFPVCLEMQEGKSRTIVSLERACGQPALEGRLEVYAAEEGFVLINELPLETYLRYVVPSEMPASYEPEALKAQAVCARTYAYVQMQAYAYPTYLAHVDDSVSFQVYGNLNTSEQTDRALNDTKGQILTYEGQPITAYYFSTSWGHTSNEDVWWEGDSSRTPYLQEKTVNETGETLDLTTEEAFCAFLEEWDDSCFDSPVSWYRWHTTVDVATLSEHLNAGLMSRYQANPEAILNKRAGKFVSAPVKSVGTIQKIEVLERGAGGVLQTIQVTGSRRTVRISTEYNIRALLNVQGETIYRQDGSEAEGGSLLPSAYIRIEPEYSEGKLTGFSIEGGGLGHGVGMSQNGANQMAIEGKSFEEILKFFYTGVDLTGLPGLS